MKNITHSTHLLSPIVAWLFLFMATTLSAQEKSKQQSLSVFVGYHSSKIQDLVFSPLIYRGSSLNSLGLAYEKMSNKSFLQISFAFDQIEVAPNSLIASPVFGTRAPSENSEFKIHLAYAHAISSTERITLYFGGLLKAKYYETDLILGLGLEESYYYENSLNPWLVLDYHLSPTNKLQVQFHLPLIAFIARPEFAIVDNENIQGAEGIAYLYDKGALSFWDDFQAFDFSFEFRRSFSGRIDGFTRYHLNYFRAENPEPLSVIENNFDLGISLKF